jgi:hypothetical protein
LDFQALASQAAWPQWKMAVGIDKAGYDMHPSEVHRRFPFFIDQIGAVFISYIARCVCISMIMQFPLLALFII